MFGYILILLSVLMTVSIISAEDQCASSANNVDRFCPFFNNRAPKPNPHLTNCTWYKENSCCRQEEIDSIFSKVKPLQGASQHCQRYINYLMCYVCAPTQNKFYKGEKLHVCEDFCNSMYDACQSAILTGSVISDLYANGRLFCESRSFEVETGVGEENERQCFTKIDDVTTSKGTEQMSNPILMLCIILIGFSVINNPLNIYPSFAGKKKKRFPSTRQNRLESQNESAQISCCDSFKFPSINVSKFWICLIMNAMYLEVATGVFLSSDVAQWAKMLSKDLLLLSHEGMKDDVAQELYDKAKYQEEMINGSQKIDEIKGKLDTFFASKIQMATELAEATSRFFEEKSDAQSQLSNVNELGDTTYLDADSAWSWSQTHPLTYDSKFNLDIFANQSCVKLSSDVQRTDENTIKTILWTNQLDKYFRKNMDEDDSIRWQYFGSNTGLMRSYPARDWPRNHIGFHDSYDPRFRPWYISATSGPKNIVIILDASSSMGEANRLSIGKKTIKTLLQTLSKDDRISIIISRSSYWSKNGDEVPLNTTLLSCTQGELIQATSSNIRRLLTSLDNVEAEGASDYSVAVKMAYSMLNSPSAQGCHNIVFFVSDHDALDGNSVRCSDGYYKYDAENRRLYQSGDKCKMDWRKLPSDIKVEELRNKVSASFFPLMIYPYGDLNKELLCGDNFLTMTISTAEEVFDKLKPYFNYLSVSSGYDRVSVTAPYLDNQGLGLVFTVSAPVYSESSRELLGVVGIDVSLSSIESMLANEVWGSAYTFMIDNHGHAFIHPASAPSSTLIADPVYIDIAQLEPREPQFEEVINDMIYKRSGEMKIVNTQRAVYSDDYVVLQDVSYTMYAYAGINASDYSIALSMADSDNLHRYPVNPTGNVTPTRVIMKDESGADILSSWEYSSVSLAPRAFCNPQAYLNEQSPTIREIEAYLNLDQADDGCPTGIYHKTVRPDVRITAALEQLWLNRHAELQAIIPWTYIGLQSGVMRVYPTDSPDRTYDPTKRPWYLHAVSNKGKLAVSSVYQDEGGIGKVVTLSRTIHRGGDPHSNCENVPSAIGCLCDIGSACQSGICVNTKCVSSVVHGVIAIDIRYDDLHRRVYNLSRKARIDCSGGCYLVDTSGNFVVHPAFLNISGADDHLYQSRSLASVHGHIFNDLQGWGIFQQHSRIDYQAKCQVLEDAACVTPPTKTKKPGPITPYPQYVGCVKKVLYYTGNWSRAEQLGVTTGTLNDDPCGSGQYYFTTVPGTNLFMLVINNYQPNNKGYSFNCHISNSVRAPGSFALLEEPCQANTSYRPVVSTKTCPGVGEILSKDWKCNLATANHSPVLYFIFMCLLMCKTVYIMNCS